MANLKFSGFTANAAVDQADSFLVGFDTDGGGANPTNNKWTFPQIAAGLAAVTATPFSIYAANGIIGTARTALLTDILRFRDFTNTNDIFTLNSNGTFTLGDGATSGANSCVAIGGSATASNANSISIGKSSSATSNGVSIGMSAGSSGANTVVIGGYASAGNSQHAVAIGYDADIASSKNGSIAIGAYINASGSNSITFNATNVNAVTTSTDNAFGVYMTSSTTPDFQIAHDGNSFITGTGNFGIGTSSPLYTLDTKGSVAGNWLARVENDSGTGFGLQVKVNSTDSTKRTFSTRNANGYTMSVYNDGVVEINGQAYTELHTNATNLVVNWNDGNVQAVTISGSAPTFAPTNPKAGATYILTLTQGATPVTVDFNSLVKWSGGAPTLSSTTGQIDVITLICYNDSGSGLYYGAASLNLA